MTRPHLCLLAFAAICLLSISSVASSQTTAKDLRSALPATLTPGINISYAAGSGNDVSVNEPPNPTPFKTYVSADGEKFYIENSLSFLKLIADHPKFFELGTEFKVGTITLQKTDIEIILLAQTDADSPLAGYAGDVKVMLGAGYQAKTPAELAAIINQMLKVGTVQTLKVKSEPPFNGVTLDCVASSDVAEGNGRSPHEVVFDESSKTAAFEIVSKHARRQKATFTDAEIYWRDDTAGDGYSLVDFALNRSTGILQVTVIKDRALYSGFSIHYNCSVRSKKF